MLFPFLLKFTNCFLQVHIFCYCRKWMMLVHLNGKISIVSPLKKSSVMTMVDDYMKDKNFPIFIPNANDARNQFENLTSELYLLALLEEEEIGRRIHTCPYTRPMRVDYYINAHGDVTFDKVRMYPETFLQLSRLL